ncbi:MAG: hypothetical protein ACO2Z5_03230 [Burkholderiaceae bacterium]
MTANRLLLLLNSLLLLLILGQRTQSEGGHLGWLQALPWNSFGTELADLSSQAQVSAGAVISLWLVLSAGWLLITFMVERQHRRAMAAAEANTNSSAAPDPALASQAHASHGQAANATAEPTFQSASAMAQEAAEPSLHTQAASQAHASNGAAAPHAAHPAAQSAGANHTDDDASIQQVLSRLQQNVPDLSPEARAELARLRAALQTLSDPETKS